MIRKHLPIWSLITATLADRIITLRFFELEANPIVIALGPTLWTIITIVTIVALTYLWYDVRGYDYEIAIAFVSGVSAMTTIAFILNVIVIVTGL